MIVERYEYEVSEVKKKIYLSWYAAISMSGPAAFLNSCVCYKALRTAHARATVTRAREKREGLRKNCIPGYFAPRRLFFSFYYLRDLQRYENHGFCRSEISWKKTIAVGWLKKKLEYTI